MDWIPGISQAKSLVQIIAGDRKGAERTQQNFLETCPVVSQGTSAVYAIQGDKKKANKVQQRFAKETLNDVADGIPVVGHIKGGIHYACGDQHGGDKAMKSSSRTIGVVAGGVGGMVVGGPVGAVAGGIAGGQAMDGITTGIDSAVHGEYRPNGGLINGIGNMANDEFSAGEGFDVIGGIGFDGLGGYNAGQGVNPGKVGAHGAKPMGQQAIYLGKKVGEGCLPVKEIRGKQFGQAAKAFVPCGITVFCKACKGTYQAAGRGARFICMNCHNQVRV